MYSRFFRWASDRVDKNGIICFVSNNSFVLKESFDGFRKSVKDEFSDIYVLDLAGDLRDDKEGNVFGIKLGIAISFFVKNTKKERCDIYYYKVPVKEAEEKLQFLAENRIDSLNFERIIPSDKNQWVNIADNNFESLIPIYSKSKKTLFLSCANAVSTNRDEWVYDFEEINLISKVDFFIEAFNRSIDQKKIDQSIKWSSTLKDAFDSQKKIKGDSKVAVSLYRPFIKKILYNNNKLSDRLTSNHFKYFGETLSNINSNIIFSSGQRAKFSCLSSSNIPNLDIFIPNGTKCLPLFLFDDNNNKVHNITDWGFNQFTKQYGKKGIAKEAIFHYVYAVLHNPAYRKKYELNLKREFPRIPFYADFKQWAAWGKALMDLHINYETVQPYDLKELPTGDKAEPKAKLKADREAGTITLDENTVLTGIPAIAWTYKLGNRSALDWVLDQYKESKPSDPTIAEKFNTYRFADYKAQVIDLLKRVCTVSVETMKIVGEMEKAEQ